VVLCKENLRSTSQWLCTARAYAFSPGIDLPARQTARGSWKKTEN